MTAYNPKYSQKNEARRRERSHRVTVDFEKTYYNETLKPSADRVGEPINTYIKKAVSDRIQKESPQGDTKP